MAEKEKENHKNYGGRGTVVQIPTEDVLGGADPRIHGLVLQRAGEDMPYASVRHPFWRNEKDDPEVRAEDMVRLNASRVPREQLVVPKAGSLTLGSEMEVFTIHEEVRRNGHERVRPFWKGKSLEEGLQNLKQPSSPEVWEYMLELNGGVSSRANERRRDFARMASSMYASVEDAGEELLYLPTSSQPFIADPNRINKHPYVARMVNEFLTFEKTQDLGASFQVHVEMLDIDSAIYAVNALRLLPPLFMAMALNGPFVQHRDSGLLSARESARRRLGTGGNMPELPNWDVLLDESVEKMKNQRIPSLPRAISQHEDFRLRPDIANGTIEFMFLDNPAGNIDKLLMFQELFRLTTWRLYQAYAYDEPLPDELFGEAASLELTRNKKVVERLGSEARIRDGNGEEVELMDQADRLLGWIGEDLAFEDDCEYSFDRLAIEVQKSLTSPRFRGAESKSMARYYEEGLGSPGQYQRALFEHWVGYGGSQNQAINNVLMDLADSYYDYLGGFAPVDR